MFSAGRSGEGEAAECDDGKCGGGGERPFCASNSITPPRHIVAVTPDTVSAVRVPGGDSIDFRNPFRKPFRNPFPKVLDFNGNFGILNFEIERLSEYVKCRKLSQEFDGIEISQKT